MTIPTYMLIWESAVEEAGEAYMEFLLWSSHILQGGQAHFRKKKKKKHGRSQVQVPHFRHFTMVTSFLLDAFMTHDPFQ